MLKNNAQFLSMNLKDRILQTIMKDPDYMRVPKEYFPSNIQQRYISQDFFHSDEYVYIKI